MNNSTGVALLALARWTLERWCAKQPWQTGGPGLDAAADQPVDGLFVTLKIEAQLRGCIGTIERQESLDATLREMAVQAAGSDPRFMPMSTDELRLSTISLSLLTSPEPVADAKSIVIGRDGLILERGGRRGLLLPEVATEFGWDLETYLEELCKKAFLPPGTWREAGCQLLRFESLKFSEAANR